MSQEAKPAYVRFEVRPVEDRTETEATGHYVAKDVVYALITPAGTKDQVEKVATDWLRDLEEMVRQERFPASWLAAYKEAYKAWCENREVPEHGIPVTDWPALSPAQVRNLQDIGLRTVEQVAEATEEAISRMGMGGRALKARAQAYIETANDTGKISEQLNNLRKQVEDLQSGDKSLRDRIKALEAENESLKKAVAKDK